MQKRTKNKIDDKFKDTTNPPRRHKVKAVGKPQYWIENKIGFNPVMCWCCGARLTIDYFKDGIQAMSARLAQFHTDHETCFPDDFALCPLLTNPQEEQAS